ncbi:NIPSNAP family protein [Streptomyces sp. 8L]|uniref:NIPSNAP family protein n=1 Tax=Streptomyces sp. 8L TaxID=2877242 RepID=UPI001CD2A35F|nr:NIPSNAP family protein [Streptomyces sp. 8L]MCA1218407.1 NIPSNAP family protein [Streptomyces sp. 8L]
MSVLEMRLFTVQPGRRAEFARVSEEGTVPMMRRFGITVVAYGSSPNNDDGYYLLRAFDSEEDRVSVQERFYASTEWVENYDKAVMDMIAAYQTAVLGSPADLRSALQGLDR